MCHYLKHDEPARPNTCGPFNIHCSYMLEDGTTTSVYKIGLKIGVFYKIEEFFYKIGVFYKYDYTEITSNRDPCSRVIFAP